MPEFSDSVHLYARACAVTGERLLYTIPGLDEDKGPALGEFLLKPALLAGRYSQCAGRVALVISGCAASADGTVLADAVDNRSSAWVLAD
jgi:hypothetical protein